MPKRVIREYPHIVLGKLPKILSKSRSDEQFIWDVSCADKEGVWSWGEARDWGDHAWDNRLLPFLRECGAKTWGRLEAETADGDKRHKEYELSAICTEAYQRLRLLKLDDLDRLYRLRRTGAERFYGFRIHSLWMVLWWDAKHKICPSPKGGKKLRIRQAEKKAAKRRG